ncbi:MAG: hypothetical protein Q8Q25_02800 [bacterium]|nr:hypothetical protein [bacterium]
MKNNLFLVFLVSLISSSLATYTVHASGLIVGTIQFPKILSTVPIIRVYTCGKKIPYHLCETNDESKQFTFRIPALIDQQKFILLITDKVHFETIHENINVIEYLKVLPGQAYKFYELTLITEKTSGSEKNEHEYRWDIKETKLVNGRIPDETIIICYDPTCIDSLSGGSPFELPTIKVKGDVLKEFGSEKNLHDLSNTLLLASIDSDTIHADIQQEVKQKAQTNIIALAA